jgi:alpha-tubulin suppressor-like RCC1 family protein
MIRLHLRVLQPAGLNTTFAYRDKEGIGKIEQLMMDAAAHAQAPFLYRSTFLFALLVLPLAQLGAPAAAASMPSGYLTGWGANYIGQLGIGTTQTRADGMPVANRRIKGLVQVAAGEDFAFAVTTNGKLYAWGADYYGQLGIGKIERYDATPTLVRGISGVTSIAAGFEHALAVTKSGQVWAWGDNESDQLGATTVASAPCYCSDKPIRVSGLPKIQMVAAGGDLLGKYTTGFSVALARDGTVWTWGSDNNGQLGVPDVHFDYPDPQKVRGVTHVVDIAAGANHVLALERDGAVRAWGDDSYGQLGDGAYCGYHTCWRSTPVRLKNLPQVRLVAAGGNDSAAVDSQGHVWSWGDNAQNQLGTGLRCNSGGVVSAGFGCAANQAGLVKGVSGVIQVAIASGYSGHYGHTLALRSDNALYAWGDNTTGELGEDPGLASESAVPVFVDRLANEAISIAAGDQFSLIVRSPQL